MSKEKYEKFEDSMLKLEKDLYAMSREEALDRLMSVGHSVESVQAVLTFQEEIKKLHDKVLPNIEYDEK
ncbi:hypothetical protein [Enterococcus sp. AZ180]|uniref:hypothetical protein n=1 Tax=Enterococcus sp. AZ180 TaxID=2774961 RepID=UPI003F22765F